MNATLRPSMFSVWFVGGISTLSILFVVFGAWNTVRFAKSRARDKNLGTRLHEGLSVIKPLKGLEEDLEANLASFFRQEHPCFELVFAYEYEADPAVEIARRLAHQHPSVACRFVQAAATTGNPKVASIDAGLEVASHDLIFQSDANVRAKPGLFQSLAEQFESHNADLLSSVVIGVGEASLGSACENLQLTTHILPCVCFALVYVNTPCVIGKSMMFRRSTFVRTGAGDLLRNVLAEDYVLGTHYQKLGLRVFLSTDPCENVNLNAGFVRFIRRHRRWLQMRAVCDFRAFVADLFAYSIGWSFVLVLLVARDAPSYFAHALVWLLCVLGIRVTTDRMVLRVFRSGLPLGQHILAAFFREMLLMFVCWPQALVSRTVAWRGVRMKIGPGSRLVRVQT